MRILARWFSPFDYSALDTQIEKFRELANSYRQSNREYFGEYLSGVLFDDQ